MTKAICRKSENSLSLSNMENVTTSKHDVSRGRRTLGICGGAHCLHDGFTDAIYVLLPIWRDALGLSLVQLGLLKSISSAALAGFQLPASFLAERFGAKAILAIGTIVAGIGYILSGFAGGFMGLALALLVIGGGCAVQHPLSSGLVADAYRNGPRRAALGIYNFTGDIGKMILPTSVALGIAFVGWRASSITVGVLGLIGGALVWLMLRRLEAQDVASAGDQLKPDKAVKGWGIRDRVGFSLLSIVGLLDTATRYAFLSFLPILLVDTKDAAIESVGFAMTLVFAGGAAGKFACGLLAERCGIIRTVLLTELLTGIGIFVLLFLPLLPSLILLPLIGIALNGTSSVLYGTVSEFVDDKRQARAFGLFYTILISSGAISPILFGAVGDVLGIEYSLAFVSLMAVSIIVLCPVLSSKIPRRPVKA